MVRLADLDEYERAHLEAKECAPFDSQPWAEGPPLAQRRVALVTTAGLHRRSDAAFSMLDLSYRVIPGDVDLADLAMSDSSVHFDRSGFREDTNLVFPLDRLRELEGEGEIGSVARCACCIGVIASMRMRADCSSAARSWRARPRA